MMMLDGRQGMTKLITNCVDPRFKCSFHLCKNLIKLQLKKIVYSRKIVYSVFFNTNKKLRERQYSASNWAKMRFRAARRNATRSKVLTRDVTAGRTATGRKEKEVK